jgi:hypothetical protein
MLGPGVLPAGKKFRRAVSTTATLILIIFKIALKASFTASPPAATATALHDDRGPGKKKLDYIFSIRSASWTSSQEAPSNLLSNQSSRSSFLDRKLDRYHLAHFGNTSSEFPLP